MIDIKINDLIPFFIDSLRELENNGEQSHGIQFLQEVIGGCCRMGEEKGGIQSGSVRCGGGDVRLTGLPHYSSVTQQEEVCVSPHSDYHCPC